MPGLQYQPSTEHWIAIDSSIAHSICAVGTRLQLWSVTCDGGQGQASCRGLQAPALAQQPPSRPHTPQLLVPSKHRPLSRARIKALQKRVHESLDSCRCLDDPMHASDTTDTTWQALNTQRDDASTHRHRCPSVRTVLEVQLRVNDPDLTTVCARVGTSLCAQISQHTQGLGPTAVPPERTASKHAATAAVRSYVWSGGVSLLSVFQSRACFSSSGRPTVWCKQISEAASTRFR